MAGIAGSGHFKISILGNGFVIRYYRVGRVTRRRFPSDGLKLSSKTSGNDRYW